MTPRSIALSLAAAAAFSTNLAAQAVDAPAQAAGVYLNVDYIALVAKEKGCATAVTALRTTYDVRDAYCEPRLLKASLPAKQKLTFTWQGQPYVLFVTARASERPMCEKTGDGGRAVCYAPGLNR